MKNLGDMMKQVQAMQGRMAELQAKLEQATVTGQSPTATAPAAAPGRARSRSDRLSAGRTMVVTFCGALTSW